MTSADYPITSLAIEAEETITIVKVDGQQYVPMRALVDRLGLGWVCQREKLLRYVQRYETRVLRITVAAGSIVEQPCIPVSVLRQWVWGLNSRSREKVGERWVGLVDKWDKARRQVSELRVDKPRQAANSEAARSLAGLRWNRLAQPKVTPQGEPDWLARLRDESDRTSQRHVAARLGYSASMVNQVLGGTYPGGLKRVENAVRSILMSGPDPQCVFETVVIRMNGGPLDQSTPGEYLGSHPGMKTARTRSGGPFKALPANPPKTRLKPGN